jgi:hypothetical protein
VTHTLVDAVSAPTQKRDTKTKRSRRPVSLNDDTLGKLRDHRRRLKDRSAFGEWLQDLGVVFCRENEAGLQAPSIMRRPMREPAWRLDSVSKQTFSRPCCRPGRWLTKTGFLGKFLGGPVRGLFKGAGKLADLRYSLPACKAGALPN